MAYNFNFKLPSGWGAIGGAGADLSGGRGSLAGLAGGLGGRSGLSGVVRGGDAYYGGTAGGMAGAAPRGYHPASGGVPGVTNPAGTVTGNLGNIGGIISSITDQQLESLRKQYPTEYFATLQQLLGNVQRRAGGDISDLLPELQTRSAEGAVGGGYSGSAMENTKLLRDLGLTRYGVEEQALKDLGLIKAGTPTVNPFDPSGVIAAIVDAQARADMYAAAPIPEEAYKRARDAALGGGGRGGGPGGGVRPGTLGGGAGAVDDILKKYGSGLGVYAAQGTRAPDRPMGLPPATYGSIPYGQSAKSWEGFDWDTSDMDFGGSLDFEGGAPWTPPRITGGVDNMLYAEDEFFWDTPTGGRTDFGGGLDYGGGAGYYDDEDPLF